MRRQKNTATNVKQQQRVGPSPPMNFGQVVGMPAPDVRDAVRLLSNHQQISHISLVSLRILERRLPDMLKTLLIVAAIVVVIVVAVVIVKNRRK